MSLQSTFQLLIHLLLYALCLYLLIKAFRPRRRCPMDCLEERGLKLASEALLDEAEFRIMMNKPMTPAQLNRFFGMFAQYFMRS
ncbi:hypothetical protein DV532_27335 (plasmid) [Pseudomonas sp. Leaf58]|uniref:hypothetical protein n=1 Tax=Pseudomonas sp. Leaf58 TaxID=1736226 RepID=UPI000700854A|nr:hypothetical protein [Pseudomonas sp. Leaf58]AYG47997.1 hypothetical protein DV532_27335 [Pseudomonas sp. Leaf58]KQN62443.1 hypothetical protein ASF02_09850 [Pseudomonas sp. Leaf58]